MTEDTTTVLSRLSQLERAHRRWKAATVAAVALLLVAWQDPQPPVEITTETLTCRRVRIVNESGQELGLLDERRLRLRTADSRGSLVLGFKGPDGKTSPSGFLDIQNMVNGEGITLDTDGPVLGLRAANGSTIYCGTNELGSGLSVHPPREQEKVGGGVWLRWDHDVGPVLQLCESVAGRSASILTDADGAPKITLRDNRGSKIAELPR